MGLVPFFQFKIFLKSIGKLLTDLTLSLTTHKSIGIKFHRKRSALNNAFVTKCE
jgi:hypothetical protein